MKHHLLDLKADKERPISGCEYMNAAENAKNANWHMDSQTQILQKGTYFVVL